MLKNKKVEKIVVGVKIKGRISTIADLVVLSLLNAREGPSRPDPVLYGAVTFHLGFQID